MSFLVNDNAYKGVSTPLSRGDEIDRALAAHGDMYAAVRAYRSLLGPRLQLSDRQAALLGVTRTERRGVPLARIVVEAMVDRLRVESITAAIDALDAWLQNALDANDWDRVQTWIWRRVVRDGDAYVILSYDAEADVPRIHVRNAYDGYTGVHVEYDPRTGQPRWGVNVWQDGEQWHRDVYYPDRIEKWVRRGLTGQWERRRDEQGEDWPLPLPLFPIVHFRHDDNGTFYGESILAGILEVQADLSEVLLDARAISRTAGFPLRYITGARVSGIVNARGEPVTNPLTGEPMRASPRLYLEPGSILDFDRPDVSVGQLPAADLADHIALADKLIYLISLITGLPMHHFTGEWPSGEAQLRAEDRWTARVADTQRDLTPAVIELVEKLVMLGGIYGRQKPPLSVRPQWEVEWFPPQPPSESVEIAREDSLARRVEMLRRAGVISVETAVRMLHPDWDDAQIQQEISRLQTESATSRVGLLLS